MELGLGDSNCLIGGYEQHLISLAERERERERYQKKTSIFNLVTEVSFLSVYCCSLNVGMPYARLQRFSRLHSNRTTRYNQRITVRLHHGSSTCDHNINKPAPSPPPSQKFLKAQPPLANSSLPNPQTPRKVPTTPPEVQEKINTTVNKTHVDARREKKKKKAIWQYVSPPGLGLMLACEG